MTEFSEDIMKAAREYVAAEVNRDVRWQYINGRNDTHAVVKAVAKAIQAERRRNDWQSIETADKDAPKLMLGIMRGGVMEEIHIGGFRYAVNEDDESCWWSDQSDDEIVPTHWVRLPATPIIEDAGSGA